MTADMPDLTTTPLVLPPDARVLDVSDLSERLRTRIGPVDEGHAVVTRPGYRVATQLVTGPLAALIHEFREPSLVTQAVLRFARKHDEDALDMLELAFDAIANLVEIRVLVPEDSPDASATVPSLGAGQEFAGFEIEALVRSLDDSEVYRARTRDGATVALKIARGDRPETTATLAAEAAILEQLGGQDSPALVDQGFAQDRALVAMEWCEGVSIGVAAQQARSTGDRRRQHSLVARLLDAYARLHACGVLHGDVHPGNCLYQDDGRVVLLDFGNARFIDSAASPTDLNRTGIPLFHDPLMAESLLAGRLPPAVTPASEQYSIAVLAYLLLTGLHPIDAPAITSELLQRISTRPPRPFAARGVAAWPGVERVLARALAKNPQERFPSVASFASAFSAAGMRPAPSERWSSGVQQAFDHEIEAVLRLRSGGADLSRQAWFALRAAGVRADAELLGAADVLSTGLGPGWSDRAISAHVARARADSRTQRAAITGFVKATPGVEDPAELGRMMRAAGVLLRSGPSPGVDRAELVQWGEEQVARYLAWSPTADASGARSDTSRAHGALALIASGAISAPNQLRDRLGALALRGDGSVWLWALANDVYPEDQFAAAALQAPRPASPPALAMALLTLHQMTGDLFWIAEAVEQVEVSHRSGCRAVDVALLVAEASVPELAIVPPFVFR